MSKMIKCDRCGKLIYDDSRSDKGAYSSIIMQYTDGTSLINLCAECHMKLLTEFLNLYSVQEFIDTFGDPAYKLDVD